MKSILKIISLVAIFASFSYVSFSQGVTVDARLDSSLILIGDQVKLTIEVNQSKSFKVDFPNIGDTLVDKVEVLGKSKIDTSYVTNDQLKLKQELTITCFDSGMYIIPAFRFAIHQNNNSDTMLSRELLLSVRTFQIDSIKGITDIKPPFETPFTIAEILNIIYIVIGVIIIGLASYFIYKRFFKKEKIVFRRQKPKEPAHVIALRELDSLTEKKLWQQNRIKEYYSELTDIVRTYCENRFDFLAMEQTTDEIIEHFEQTKLIDTLMLDKLSEMLRLSDLVKFAKLIPLSDENDKVLKTAYSFVIKTKQEVALFEKPVDENGENNSQTVDSQSSLLQTSTSDKNQKV